MNWTRTNLEDDILWVPMEEADTEIERLRSDIRDMAATIEGQVGVVIGLQAEIERLRGQLLNVLDMVADAPIEQLRQEIEKLRASEQAGNAIMK